MVADERCEPIVALCAAPSLHGWPTTALMASTRSELYAFRRTLSSKFDTPSSVYDESVGGAPTRREELSDDTGDSFALACRLLSSQSERRCRGLSRKGGGIRCRDDYVNPSPDQVGGKIRKPFCLALCSPPFQHEILALDVAAVLRLCRKTSSNSGAETRVSTPMRYTFPVGCAVAHSGATVRPTTRTIASPIRRMAPRGRTAGGSLADDG